jgi:TolB-like protein
MAVVMALCAARGVAADVAKSAATPKQKVVVTGLVGSDAATEKLAATLTDSVLTELTRSGAVDPVSPRDLTAVLGMERQKQLLGCAEDSSACMAEMTAALGAPWVLTGSLSRAGKATRLDLKLIHAQDGRVAWRDGKTVTEESALYDAVSELVRAMVGSSGLGPVAAVGGGSKVGAWVTVGLGAAALVAGGVLSYGALHSYGNLQSNEWRAATYWTGIQAETASYRLNVILGPSLAGVGAVALVVGLVWALSGQSATSPTVVMVPTANGFAFGGVW